MFTKTELRDELLSMYFKYTVTYARTLETPEEGVWYCNGCGIEFEDEHYDYCDYKEEFETIEKFIARFR